MTPITSCTLFLNQKFHPNIWITDKNEMTRLGKIEAYLNVLINLIFNNSTSGTKVSKASSFDKSLSKKAHS